MHQLTHDEQLREQGRAQLLLEQALERANEAVWKMEQ